MHTIVSLKGIDHFMGVDVTLHVTISLFSLKLYSFNTNHHHIAILIQKIRHQ